MNEKFLLNSDLAIDIYNEIKDLPINDYHNHLSPKEIYENKPFTNINDMWLEHDHYKWRLIRFSGYNDRPNNKFEQFENYIKAIEFAYMNPLYHWTEMELDICFNIKDQISSKNAKLIYDKANTYLKENPFGPRELLTNLNVESLCTTDDIKDDLKYHKLIKEDKYFNIKVLPTFRPDTLFTPSREQFMETFNFINSIHELEEYLEERIEYFHAHGCRISDHGVTDFKYVPTSLEEAILIFNRRKTIRLTSNELIKLHSYIFSILMRVYQKHGWTAQFHIGPLRNTNTRMFNKFGKDAGYDSISGYEQINDLNVFLNDINQKQELPRMIIYTINSNQYQGIATTCANFSNGKPGHIQLGGAWWFHDHISGIEKQLQTFGEYLNINYFLGMVTDSRSFLSFVRHDYFRRILSNFLAENVKKGRMPNNIEGLKTIARNLSYNNSKNYLHL